MLCSAVPCYAKGAVHEGVRPRGHPHNAPTQRHAFLSRDDRIAFHLMPAALHAKLHVDMFASVTVLVSPAVDDLGCASDDLGCAMIAMAAAAKAVRPTSKHPTNTTGSACDTMTSSFDAAAYGPPMEGSKDRPRPDRESHSSMDPMLSLALGRDVVIDDVNQVLGQGAWAWAWACIARDQGHRKLQYAGAIIVVRVRLHLQ